MDRCKSINYGDVVVIVVKCHYIIRFSCHDEMGYERNRNTAKNKGKTVAAQYCDRLAGHPVHSHPTQVGHLELARSALSCQLFLKLVGLRFQFGKGSENGKNHIYDNCSNGSINTVDAYLVETAST